MKIKFEFKAETKSCYRFENREGDDLTSLYLKKKKVEAAGIDPKKGIAITVEQNKEDK